jgi:hypothetical protein
MKPALKAGPLRTGFLFKDAFLEDIFRNRYSAFLDQTEPDISVTVCTKKELVPGYSRDVCTVLENHDMRITSSFMELIFTADMKKGSLFISDNISQAVDSLENGLRVMTQWIALFKGLFMVHAACVGNGGDSILLPASEGGGKTTIASLCEDKGCDVYGDDLVMIYNRSSGPEVYSLPFRGEETIQEFHKGSASLKQVVFIGKGTGIELRKLSAAEACAMLMSNIPYIANASEDVIGQVMNMAEQTVRCGAYECRYDLEGSPEDEILKRLKSFSM